jgi:heme oxygenase
MERIPTIFEHPLHYTNDTTGREGYTGKVRTALLIDKSNAFNLDNKGELTSSQYMIYLGILEDKKIIGKIPSSSFPKVKPKKSDFQRLEILIAERDLDL